MCCIIKLTKNHTFFYCLGVLKLFHRLTTEILRSFETSPQFTLQVFYYKLIYSYLNIINYKYYTNIYIIQATRSIAHASQGIIEASDEMPPACHPLTACGHTAHNSATGHNVTVQLAWFIKRDSAHSITVLTQYTPSL
jgi:hypothetical protein